jgi:hypothetical protein
MLERCAQDRLVIDDQDAMHTPALCFDESAGLVRDPRLIGALGPYFGAERMRRT